MNSWIVLALSTVEMQCKTNERVRLVFYIGCYSWWSAPRIKGDSFYIDIILLPLSTRRRRDSLLCPTKLNIYIYNIVEKVHGVLPLFDQKGSHIQPHVPLSPVNVCV